MNSDIQAHTTTVDVGEMFQSSITDTRTGRGRLFNSPLIPSANAAAATPNASIASSPTAGAMASPTLDAMASPTPGRMASPTPVRMASPTSGRRASLSSGNNPSNVVGSTLIQHPGGRVQRVRRFAQTQDNVPEYSNSSSIYNIPYTNQFIIDGIRDPSNWVYVPIKVIYRRFNTYTQRGRLLPAKNDKCAPLTEPNTGKVWVQSDGISYSGHYKDYVVFSDKSEQETSKFTYVAINKPGNMTVKTFLTAHDSCGRACSPMCIGQGSIEQTYKPCTGAFNVTSDLPRMFAEDKSASPSFARIVPIVFVCDLELKWPWEI